MKREDKFATDPPFIGTVSAAEDKRGHRIVHGDKEPMEKLRGNDLCPCPRRR
jgi:hypothetical protein